MTANKMLPYFFYFFLILLNFFSPVDQCGGVLNGDEGGISYKLNETLAWPDECVWTIYTPNYREINVTFDGIDFRIYTLRIYHDMRISGSEYFFNQTTTFYVSGAIPQTEVLIGPLVYVHLSGFYRGSPSKGFTLDYAGVGEPVDNNSLYNYTMESPSESGGRLDFYQGYPGPSQTQPWISLILHNSTQVTISNYSNGSPEEPFETRPQALSLYVFEFYAVLGNSGGMQSRLSLLYDNPFNVTLAIRRPVLIICPFVFLRPDLVRSVTIDYE